MRIWALRHDICRAGVHILGSCPIFLEHGLWKGLCVCSLYAARKRRTGLVTDGRADQKAQAAHHAGADGARPQAEDGTRIRRAPAVEVLRVGSHARHLWLLECFTPGRAPQCILRVNISPTPIPFSEHRFATCHRQTPAGAARRMVAKEAQPKAENVTVLPSTRQGAPAFKFRSRFVPSSLQLTYLFVPLCRSTQPGSAAVAGKKGIKLDQRGKKPRWSAA
jgi:hypothetical protein